jgi:succinate dehydrogenase hydrophobic anchor subunit
MKPLKNIFLLIIFLCPGILLHAQNGNKVEMADMMRSNGRIYVVVAVMLTILLGLILYIVRLDRKVTKLEKESH